MFLPLLSGYYSNVRFKAIPCDNFQEVTLEKGYYRTPAKKLLSSCCLVLASRVAAAGTEMLVGLVRNGVLFNTCLKKCISYSSFSSSMYNTYILQCNVQRF